MAPHALALRFRDTTPQVDTIAAHRALISQHGKVWWGWWKKSFEEDHRNSLETLAYPTLALIVDRSTRRMFSASISRWHRSTLGQENLSLVPAYYKNQQERVFGWFEITKIDDVEYREQIANRFGDSTLAILGESELHENKVETGPLASAKSCVLHLSDVHFGADYDFLVRGTTVAIGETRKTLTECIVEDLKRVGLHNEIGGLIVTGDFVTAGNWQDKIRNNVLQEFAALRKELALEKEQIIAVAGNHDIIRYPVNSGIDPATLSVTNQSTYQHEREFRTFVDELVGRSWKEPLNYVHRLRLGTADLLVGVLNSCSILATEWTEYGYVGDSGLDALNELARQSIDKPTYKMMALHHHLLPVTGVAAPNSKGVTLSLDAPRVLDAAQKAGVQIALHGHEHMPRLAKYQTLPLMGGSPSQPLLVVSNGSTGVSAARRPGNERNTYCIFRFGNDVAHLWMRELRPDSKTGSTLFDADLDLRPSI